MKRFMKYLMLIVGAALFSTLLNAQSSVVHDRITARQQITVGDSTLGTGNVGISTKNPTQKLDINGGIRVRVLGEGIVVSDANGVLAVDSVLTLDSIILNYLYSNRVRVNRDSFTDPAATIASVSDSGFIVQCNANCDDIRWTTINGSQTVLKDTTDLVGIGTTNPTANLHVVGDVIMSNSNGAISQLIQYTNGSDSLTFIEVRNNAITLEINGPVYSPAFGINADGTAGFTGENLQINSDLTITDGTQADGYVLTSDAGGNATWQDPNAAPAARQSSTITPTDGGSDTIPDNTEVFIMNPASLLATYTLTLPANPVTNQLLRIVSSGFGITALTLNANTGQSIVGTLTTLAANVNALYFFDGSVWIKL